MVLIEELADRREDELDNDELRVDGRRLPLVVLEVRPRPDREQDAVVIEHARKHFHRQTEVLRHVRLAYSRRACKRDARERDGLVSRVRISASGREERGEERRGAKE